MTSSSSVIPSRADEIRALAKRSRGTSFLRRLKERPLGFARGDGMALLVVLLLACMPGHAVEPSEMLKDPALEARAREIGRALRCVVCQNQAVDDSNAEVAHDMRRAVRERLSAGDSDRQVMDFMVARYGDYVLLKPPFKADTWLLWLGGPLVLLLAGAGLALAARKRRPVEAPPAPLTDEERARVDELLQPVASTGAKRSGEALSAAGKVSPRAPSALGRDDG